MVDRPLPKTEALSRRVITLPFFTSITPEQIEWVVSSLETAGRDLA
jgi:dTDP-4-amino-4,6-dideoxygalactose transaminase